MPPKETDEQAIAESIADTLEEPDDVMQLLEREEAKIIERSDKGASVETEEEEPSAEPEVEPSAAGVDSRELLTRLDTLTSVVNALISGKKPEGDDSEDDFDVEYDVGDLDDEYEALRPALNRMGLTVHRELASLQANLQKLASSVHNTFDEMSADRVREKYSISPGEEDKIVNWAKERGMRYENARQLALVVEDYRKLNKALGTPPAPKAKAKVDTSMSATKPTGTKTFNENDVRKPGRRTFNESFDHGVQETIRKLRSGRLAI